MSTLPHTTVLDEDTAMDNLNGGQPDQHPQPVPTDTEIFQALIQELAQSRQSADQVITMLMNERMHPSSHHETGSKKSLAADPQPFDGTSGKFEEFLSDLRLCFLADPVRFNTDRKRIIFALSYMKGGSAHAWAMNVSDRYGKGEEVWVTWTQFETALRGRFEMGDRKVEAQEKLRSLQQAGRSAEVFFDEFEAQRQYSGLNEEACVQLLRYNLDRRLVDSIYNQNELPTTYVGWRDLAIRKDRQYREAQSIARRGHWGNPGGITNAWRGGGHGGTSGGGRGGYGGGRGGQPSGSYQPGRGMGDGNTHRQGEPSTRSGSSGSGDVGTTSGTGAPMDIDRRRGGNMGVGECFICHEMGHFARNCPRRAPGMQRRSLIRGVFSGMTDEERNEMLKDLQGFQNSGE